MAHTNREIFRGDTPTFRFTLKKKNLDGKKVPFSLVGTIVLKFLAKTNLGDADLAAIFNRTCTIVAPAEDGVCEVKLTAADTATAGEFVAELQYNKDAGGTVLTLIQFKLHIKEDVVRTA